MSPPEPRHRLTSTDLRAAFACLAGTVAGAWGLQWAFHRAPLEAEMRYSQKIFYFHAPLGIWTLLLALLAAAAGIAYLWKRREAADLLGESLMEVCVLSCAVVLATGSLWAKPAWGSWFPWGEPRVTLMLVLFLIGLAYHALRSSVDEPGRRARFSAVVAILGALVAVFAYSAIHIWETTHPRIITTSGIAMQADMKRAFYACIVATGLLTWALVEVRLRLAALRSRVERLAHDVQEMEDFA